MVRGAYAYASHHRDRSLLPNACDISMHVCTCTRKFFALTALTEQAELGVTSAHLMADIKCVDVPAAAGTPSARYLARSARGATECADQDDRRCGRRAK